MSKFYILLFTVIIYCSLRTLIDLMIEASHSSSIRRIKRKILLHTILLPALFAIMILITILTKSAFFNIYIGFGFIVASLSRDLFGKRKYLAKLEISKDEVSIQYITALLKTEQRSLLLFDISDINTEKPHWLTDFHAKVNLRYKDERIEFYLLDKALTKDIQRKIEVFVEPKPKTG